MEQSEIINELTNIWRNELDDNKIVLNAATTAKEVEGWDSLTNIQLIVATERKYKVRFSASEIMNFKNVGDLADAVLKKKENA
jgi:acyl carrier protein